MPMRMDASVVQGAMRQKRPSIGYETTAFTSSIDLRWMTEAGVKPWSSQT